jgi:hypothetical protein
MLMLANPAAKKIGARRRAVADAQNANRSTGIATYY